MFTLKTSDSQACQTKTGTVKFCKLFHSVHRSSSLLKYNNSNIGKCCICEQEFEKKRKGFKSCKVTTLGEPSTLNVYHPPWTKPHLKLVRTIYVSPASTRTTEKPFLPPDARRGIKWKLPPNGTLPEEKEKKMRKGMKSSFNKSTQKTYKTKFT